MAFISRLDLLGAPDNYMVIVSLPKTCHEMWYWLSSIMSAKKISINGAARKKAWEATDI